MAGFLYFTSDTPKAALEHLGYAFEAKPIQHEIVGAGPSGKRGIMLAGDSYKGSMQLVGYHASKQTWRRVPGVEADLWCGFYNDDRPTPDDCKRKKQLTGYWVELLDGKEWLIPVGRTWSEAEGQLLWDEALPRAMGGDDEGNWVVGDVVPRYREMWSIVKAAWDARSKISDPPSDADVCDWCTVAMRTNYRISKTEIQLMGLVGYQEAIAIVKAIIDEHRRDAMIERLLSESDGKKKVPVLVT